jgi:hypothetical protein
VSGRVASVDGTVTCTASSIADISSSRTVGVVVRRHVGVDDEQEPGFAVGVVGLKNAPKNLIAYLPVQELRRTEFRRPYSSQSLVRAREQYQGRQKQHMNREIARLSPEK